MWLMFENYHYPTFNSSLKDTKLQKGSSFRKLGYFQFLIKGYLKIQLTPEEEELLFQFLIKGYIAVVAFDDGYSDFQFLIKGYFLG